MKKPDPLPEIARFVFELMPNATKEEQIVATQNFRAYLAVVYRIFLRFEAEGRLDEIHDKLRERDRVKNE